MSADLPSFLTALSLVLTAGCFWHAYLHRQESAALLRAILDRIGRDQKPDG